MNTGDANNLSGGAQMVANRLRKNLRRLKNWRTRQQVTCYRVYDADLPEYAAAIDVYAECGGEQRQYLHVQEYRAPANVPVADADRRFAELLAAVREVFAVPAEQIATKTRERGPGGARYGRFAEDNRYIVVQEGRAKFWVNLFDYIDTGLFLDHRPMRMRVAETSAGKRVLNLFCYTASASVHAVVGGAASSVSVDLSNTYVDWAEQNFELNDIPREHRLVRSDVLAFLAADDGRYDLIFCDPPTFSNSKSAADFDVQRDHVRLLQLAMARLAPSGVLLFSNNFRRFKLDGEAVGAFAQWRDIAPGSIDIDFQRNPRIHLAFELTHLD